MRLALALLVLGITACGAPVTPSACSTGGDCPCSSGGECRPALTCTTQVDWLIFDCTCSSTNRFVCTSHPKPSGACESAAYCNKGMTGCQAETATCNRDCRCEYTTTRGQGVWICQDNCADAKDCPKTQPIGACSLSPTVQCRYWSATDYDVSCACGAGQWTCT